MLQLPKLLIAALLAWPAAAKPPGRVTVDDFIAAERAVALQGVLDNIGPNGTQVPGAGRGIVIASPSKVDPNCKSSVTADSSGSMNMGKV